MNKSALKNEMRTRRQKRIRAKIAGTAEVPRLSIFRSNKFMYAQLIDDDKQHTIASASTQDIKTGKPAEKAREIGKKIAEKAVSLKITQVVFDRGGYIYTGNVKEVADGARGAGLKF
jgi:large subunit ribosomal protein L18